MNTGARLAAALIAVVLLTAGSCDVKPSPSGHPSKAAAPPPAVGGVQPPAPEANQPGPEADPQACNPKGERDIELQAYWFSETDKTPSITWSKNGDVTPATNLRAERVPAGRIGWRGDWSTLIRAKCGDVIVLKLAGSPAATGCGLAIVDLGDGPHKTGERNCTATYTVV